MTSRKPGFKTTYLIFSVVFAAVLILITALAIRFSFRFDMTKEKIFTISPSTKQIFSRLKDKVKVTFYTSEKLPTELESLRRDTIDKFKEFEVISGGNFQYEIIEPLKKIREEELRMKDEPKKEDERDMFNPYARSESETRNQLMQKGIQELQGRRLERDKLEVVNFFSSLEISYLDKPSEIIQVYESAENLEYELASRILRLTSPALPKVAFFDGNPKDIEQRMNPRMPPQKISRYAPLIDAFGDTVQIEEIKLNEASPIPMDAKCLVIAQPKNLNERQKYEINKYLSEGGNVILLTSRGTIDFGGQNFMMENITSGLENLLSSWGIVIGEKLIASLDMGQINITQRGRGMQITQSIALPYLVRTRNADFDSTSPILKGIPYLILPWCNPINIDETKIKALGLQVEKLATTGKEVWLKPVFPFLNDAVIKVPDKSEFAEKQTVAVLLQGNFPFTYEGKEIPSYPPAQASGNERMSPEDYPMIMPPSQPPDDADENKTDETKTETLSETEEKEPAEPAVKETEVKESGDEKKENEAETKSEETGTETKEEPAKEGVEVKEETKEPEKKIAPKITPKKGNLLIVSSSDLVNVDYVQNRSYQPNLLFFRNAIEIFSLGEELINIRAKTVTERSLKDTTDGQRFRYKALNMVAIPFLLIAFGVIRYAVRRRQAVIAQKK